MQSTVNFFLRNSAAHTKIQYPDMGRKASSRRLPAELSQGPLRQSVIPSAGLILHDNGIAHQDENDLTRTRGINGAEIDHASTTSSFPETQELSDWVTSPDLIQKDLPFTQDIMYNLNNFLLGNPNMNSPHLFRADILFDSAGQLKTPEEKERLAMGVSSTSQNTDNGHVSTASAASINTSDSSFQGGETGLIESKTAPHIPGFKLKRTVTRMLIPRRPNLDRPLKQTCLQYEANVPHPDSAEQSRDATAGTVERALYMFLPDLKTPEDVPYYHPLVRGWAFLYDFERTPSSASVSEPSAQAQPETSNMSPQEGKQEEKDTTQSLGKGTLSLHFLPFPPAEGFEPFPTRLERILQNLMAAHIRLARHTRSSSETTGTGIETDATSGSASTSEHTTTSGKKQEDDSYNPDKDNLIPRHMIQNTYSRLKTTHAQHLCQRWVESTEPSKHVFEDLLITAFLIELWRNMYGVVPKAEREDSQTNSLQQQKEANTGEQNVASFPGFIDIACGNGVLVYVLLMEGYEGWGFDARQRKTWSIFPDWIQFKLKESIYIPKPFVEAVADYGEENPMNKLMSDDSDAKYTIGDFPKNTFVISNHADELTVWTPLLAALACPEDPLPFLSIPCCSHSLSGARYRYRAPKKEKSKNKNTPNKGEAENNDTGLEEKEAHTTECNDKTGDLKALRAEKQAGSTSNLASDPNSAAVFSTMYGSLTAKTMSVAGEVGYEVERTLLRIPSTRNIGVIGGRLDAVRKWQGLSKDDGTSQHQQRLSGLEGVQELVNEVVNRECEKDGGLHAAAKMWIERAIGLQKGKK